MKTAKKTRLLWQRYLDEWGAEGRIQKFRVGAGIPNDGFGDLQIAANWLGPNGNAGFGKLLAHENHFLHEKMKGGDIGELCALDWSDIDWEQRTIFVCHSVVEGVMGSPKNNRTRLIPITNDLYALLWSYRRPSGIVFPGPDGNHMRKSSWPWKALYRACDRAGLPKMGWHTLRHTFASQLTAQAVPMKAIQIMLGHSTVQMTERYSHLAQSSLHDAVALLPKAEEKTVLPEINVNQVSTHWQNQSAQAMERDSTFSISSP